MTRRQVRTFRETFLLLAPFLLSFFRLSRAKENDENDAKGAWKRRHFLSLQDLRRPSIDERANESAELGGVFQSESLENRRWRRLECPRIYFAVRFFLRRAVQRGLRARTRLIFKVPDERNESRVSRFKLVLSILRPAGIIDSSLSLARFELEKTTEFIFKIQLIRTIQNS